MLINGRLCAWKGANRKYPFPRRLPVLPVLVLQTPVEGPPDIDYSAPT